MSFPLGESEKSTEETDQECPYVFVFSFLRGINSSVWKVRVKNSMTKTTTKAWLGGREHSSTHHDKIGLKIYWAWSCPSEQDPVSPSVSLSHQETSISFLFSSIRGQTDWKPQSQKTNQLSQVLGNLAPSVLEETTKGVTSQLNLEKSIIFRKQTHAELN